MGKKPNADASLQFRFVCPKGDKQVLDWIDAQHSISASLRVVIKDFIARHGLNDATCQQLIIENTEPRIYKSSNEDVATVTAHLEPAVPITPIPVSPVMTEPTNLVETAKPIDVNTPVEKVEQSTMTSDSSDMLEELMK